MTPGALWLLLASVALWTGLPAAPPPWRTSGQPPLPPSGPPGEAPQDKIWQEEEARLARVAAQKSPLPQGKESGGHGEVGEGSLPPEAAGIPKENPQPERPPANNLEVGSPGGPRPVEDPQGASQKDPRAEPGGAPASPGGKEKPRSLGRPRLASKPAWPILETWNPVWDPGHGAPSAGKTNTSPGEKPRPPAGKASPTEEPDPGSGHTAQHKPASAAGPQVGPPSGEEPGGKRGPEAPGEKPPSGEKLPSPVGEEKRPSAPSEKPEEGEKPGAEKTEKETEEGEKREEAEEEEEGLFDEDEEGGEGGKGQENKGGPPEGNQEGSDAFDKELDYGLDEAPFDAYSYHDAWSDEGAELALMGETAALPQAGDAHSGGKPTFDAWGDLVGGSRP